MNLDRYSLVCCEWRPEFTPLCRRIPNDDPGDFAEIISQRVALGIYKVATIRDESGEELGFTVYFVDTEHGQRELVSVCTLALRPAKRGDTRFSKSFDSLLVDLARQLACTTIRMHTMRPGLLAKAFALGWHTAEIIIRKHV